MQETMRAVQVVRAGGPEALHVRTLPVPRPGRGEVLVRVGATSVNPVDAMMRRMRVLRTPRGTGMDFAGTIAAIGAGVRDLAPGQRVWGYVTSKRSTGPAADFVIARRNQVGAAPAGLSFVEAASLPTVGLPALRALRDAVRLRAGDRLLVIGASGGTGSATVQLGRAMGAHVTAIASAANAGFCRGLGAEEALAYDDPTIDALPATFDALVDCHGGSLRRYRRLLRRGGRGAEFAVKGFAYAMTTLLRPGPTVRIVIADARDLDALAARVEAGELRPVVDSVHPLEAIRDVHRAVETGHARGKRVIDLRL